MVNLLRTTSSNPDFAFLVRLLDEDLLARYGSEQAQYDKHNKIENNPTVVIAYLDREPVGCACLKTIDVFTAELKRMYVRPEHRGKSIGVGILNELEDWAAELSFGRIILETAQKQPEAINLYKKAGFEIIPNYPPYDRMEKSICMAKQII
ncbi:MAG TPA: GNAT family N-acetyltransferase [Chryseosolibacter sp.]|nr:GNAT family N-acetyltransferase [Chryseosolibacter sp.]